MWDTESYEKWTEAIQIKQNILVELDTVGLLVNLLASDMNEKIKIEVLKAFVAILLGGNTLAQDQLIETLNEIKDLGFIRDLFAYIKKAENVLKDIKKKQAILAEDEYETQEDEDGEEHFHSPMEMSYLTLRFA
jgi:hypothetical protein